MGPKVGLLNHANAVRIVADLDAGPKERDRRFDLTQRSPGPRIWKVGGDAVPMMLARLLSRRI